MTISQDLNTAVEEAVIAWLANSAAHGQDVGITPRRWAQAKFDDNGDLNNLSLPALVVHAARDRQLHTKVAVFLFTVDTWLFMQADDTNESAWDAMTAKLETNLPSPPVCGFPSPTWSCRSVHCLGHLTCPVYRSCIWPRPSARTRKPWKKAN